jgi:hypothetical protein
VASHHRYTIMHHFFFASGLLVSVECVVYFPIFVCVCFIVDRKLGWEAFGLIIHLAGTYREIFSQFYQSVSHPDHTGDGQRNPHVRAVPVLHVRPQWCFLQWPACCKRTLVGCDTKWGLVPNQQKRQYLHLNDVTRSQCSGSGGKWQIQDKRKFKSPFRETTTFP